MSLLAAIGGHLSSKFEVDHAVSLGEEVVSFCIGTDEYCLVEHSGIVTLIKTIYDPNSFNQSFTSFVAADPDFLNKLLQELPVLQ